jgi:predicted ABC-type ATPase
MTDFAIFDRRPLIIAIAGSNGAGKSSFYRSRLRRAGLPFVNADDLSRELNFDAYAAAERAEAIRQDLLRRGESFIFETVLSDPVGEKVGFLKQAEDSGFSVAFCFIGIPHPDVSEARVSQRVSRGGHDVPRDKIQTRFARTLDNLSLAIRTLSNVLVFDNSDLSQPYRLVAAFQSEAAPNVAEPLPDWLKPCLPDASS